ncbi:MAG: M23 family metallopeptidase [Clostridia bacterium]|nr:M23 family metallopeptidase [Clostridia bacterium]
MSKYTTQSRHQRKISDDSIYENNIKANFKAQILICILIFIFCILIKFYPNKSFDKIESGISLILSENTEIRAELKKIKSMFFKDESLDTLTPVSEMVAPSSGSVARGFGMQDASNSGFHYGLDLYTAPSENIVAVSDGEVTEIATSSEYGSFLVIKHSDEISTLYGNLNEILINVNDKVSKGQPIARAGGENSTFYFELRRGDTYLDPTEFIEFGK